MAGHLSPSPGGDGVSPRLLGRAAVWPLVVLRPC